MDDDSRKPHISLYTEDDDDIVTVSNSDRMFGQAFSSLNELRRLGQLCDVVLHIQGRRLSAHRVVLSAVIPYFRSMFTMDMVEASQRDIYLQDLEAETVEQLVNYAYTGEIRVSAGNIQDLMAAANFFNLDELVEQCASYLKPRLSTANVLSIKIFCASVGCTTILPVVNRFIQKHFLSVSRSEDFLHLCVEDVEELLARDELYVEGEEQIFEAAIKWVQHDPTRRKFAPRVLACVRLPLLKPSFLTDEVASHYLVRGDLACRDLLDEAKDYHLMPERRSLLKSFRTKQRCCTDVPGLIFAVGGLTSVGDCKSLVEMFDPLINKWMGMRAMTTLRSRVGVAASERKVYAIGGFNGQERLNVVEVFDFNKSEWRTVSPLNKKRSALGAAFMNGKLYVCGGYDGVTSLSTVEIYSPDTDTWEMGQNMSKQRSAAAIVVMDGYLYAIGGHDGMSIFNSAERFCSETSEWKPIANMLGKRCRCGAAAMGGKIYLCGGYDGSQFLNSVECYDPATNEWTPVTPMNIKRSRVSVAATANCLYAIGGYDGISNLSSMEVYREDTDKWDLAPSMCTHEGGVGVGVIPIPPEMLT